MDSYTFDDGMVLADIHPDDLRIMVGVYLTYAPKLSHGAGDPQEIEAMAHAVAALRQAQAVRACGEREHERRHAESARENAALLRAHDRVQVHLHLNGREIGDALVARASRLS